MFNVEMFLSWANNRVVPNLPYLGVAVGIVSGIWARHAASDWEKDFPSCCQGFQSNALQTINQWKHWEVITFNFLFTPRTIVLLKDIISLNSVNRVQQAFKRISKEEVVAASILVFGNILWYAGALDWMGSEKDFDISGHVIVKTGTSYFATKTLQALKDQNRSKVLIFALSSLLAFTDAVLLHNTARFCHSGEEVVAGVITAVLFLKTAAIAQKALGALIKLNSTSLSRKTHNMAFYKDFFK
ncbi:MAG: hypothetical protein JSR57_09140 [Verrucomicrobia bacterium]|nr:hypothetical protein [Verrucomicrobiota bacterium]